MMQGSQCIAKQRSSLVVEREQARAFLQARSSWKSEEKVSGACRGSPLHHHLRPTMSQARGTNGRPEPEVIVNVHPFPLC